MASENRRTHTGGCKLHLDRALRLNRGDMPFSRAGATRHARCTIAGTCVAWRSTDLSDVLATSIDTGGLTRRSP